MELRVAVGSPDRPRSHVWKYWINRDDVYFGARVPYMGMAFKVSLHQSGVWRIAWVPEFDDHDPERDRLILRWQRPGEIHPGITPSANVIVTGLLPEQPLLPMLQPEDARVNWLPWTEGRRTVFAGFFVRDDASIPTLLGGLPAGAAVIARFPLQRPETYVLVRCDEPVDAMETAQVQDTRRSLTIKMSKDSDVAKIREYRALTYSSPTDLGPQVQPTIFDVAIGRESLRIEGSE